MNETLDAFVDCYPPVSDMLNRLRFRLLLYFLHYTFDFNLISTDIIAYHLKTTSTTNPISQPQMPPTRFSTVSNRHVAIFVLINSLW